MKEYAPWQLSTPAQREPIPSDFEMKSDEVIITRKDFETICDYLGSIPYVKATHDAEMYRSESTIHRYDKAEALRILRTYA